MRTAKYNDFTIFRILLFCLVIVIGVLAYLKFVTPPCEHINTSVVTNAATCTEEGYSYKQCNDCGEKIDNKIIPANGHVASDKEIVIEQPTCSKTGRAYVECSVCKEMIGDFISVPTIAHTPGNEVVENEKQHTAAQGASYENVVYCTECKYEISREKVDVEHTVNVSSNVVVEPTCTEAGTMGFVYFCVECNKPISSSDEAIEALGHVFEWQLTYNGETEKLTVNGVCNRSECDHNYDPAVDTEYTYVIEKDEANSYEPNCVSGYNAYVATIYHNGEKIDSVSYGYKVKPVEGQSHVLYIKVTDANGNYVIDPNGYNVDEEGYLVDDENNRVDFLIAAAQYDENGVYYNISTPGFKLVYNVEDGQTEAEAKAAAWDANGFGVGVFACFNTNGDVHWVAVRVYNDLA